ncbi:MAG: UxaA family hydrolase [Clostridiales bacterium]|nr:UxaA family hydrolase [Clostridiales bacterium]
MKKAIKLSPIDNVATCLSDIVKGDKVVILDKENNVIREVECVADVGRGHKIAVNDILSGENVVKYGYVIGMATKPIVEGEFVHVHNLESCRGRGDKA